MTAIDTPQDILTAIRDADHLVITSHANPDGDAIGSALGAARILRLLGKTATVWMADPVPSIYRQLPGSERVHVGQEIPNGFPVEFDAALVLECPSLDRTGLEETLKLVPQINIDHHLGNQHYGSVNWIDTGAAAVGEMVFRLANDLKARIDVQAATCLYLALASDTGGFRFGNTSAHAFETAAALVELGAPPETVSGWLYESRPAATIRLLGSMIATLELHGERRLATAHLTAEMYSAAGASHQDTEGLIDTPRSIDGVDVVALIRELETNRYKVSLRSRGQTADVERVARLRGGGGHRNAAGCEVQGTIDSVREEIVADLLEAMEAQE